MLYAIILFASIVLMVKVANAEDRSPALWGGITFVIGCVLWVIPIPFFIVLTPVISFGIMFILNLKK